jgi:aminobenzoyl-glutamate utilization protein B
VLAAQTPPLADLKKEAMAEIDKRQKLIQEMVDSIFSFAELEFQETETSKYLIGLLEKTASRWSRRGGYSHGVGGHVEQRRPEPVIAFITDIDDCIPRASQKPGVAYHDPIIENAPGHGEGHNSGMAVNIVAALALKDLMKKHNIRHAEDHSGSGGGVVATKAYFVRAGLFKDADIVLGSHVGNEFRTSYGQSAMNTGLVSIQYTFKGEAAHAAGAPWRGKSALDAVELMNTGWNFKREHLRTQQRSHYVIVNGGDQPNVVPSEATVWYYFRELDYLHIKELQELGDTMAKAATMMTGTTLAKRVVGSAWPEHLNKPMAEVQHKNIELVGMPQWSEADQTLAKALQREINAPSKDGLKEKIEAVGEPPKDDNARRGVERTISAIFRGMSR